MAIFNGRAENIENNGFKAQEIMDSTDGQPELAQQYPSVQAIINYARDFERTSNRTTNIFTAEIDDNTYPTTKAVVDWGNEIFEHRDNKLITSMFDDISNPALISDDLYISPLATLKLINLNNNKNWELLNEVTLDSAVSSITISADSDGNTFKCSELLAKIVSETNSDYPQTTGSLTFVGMPVSSNLWLNRLAVPEAISKTAKKYVIAHLKLDSNYVFGQGSVASSNAASGQVYRDGMSGTLGNSADHIGKFYIQCNLSSGTIAAGTTVTLYGKRIKE